MIKRNHASLALIALAVLAALAAGNASPARAQPLQAFLTSSTGTGDFAS